MEITTGRRRHEIDHLKQHSMKNNLIFKFDDTTDIGKEIEGEDSVSVVRQFLIQVMHVPNASNFYIPIAHRLGDPRNKHRAILARFPITAELDLILRHGNRLRGTRHGVSRQTPPSMIERNQFAMNTYNAKRIDFNSKARLSNGKLFVKGKVQTDFLEPRLPDPEPADEDYQVEVAQSGTIKDSGSDFKGFAVSVNSLSDVTAGIQEVMMTMPDVSTASHLISVYRVKNGQSGHIDYTDIDNAIVKLKENNMTIRGHTLLWNKDQGNPYWVRGYTGAALKNEVLHRISDMINHFKNDITEWDLCNEYLHGHFYEEKTQYKDMLLSEFQKAYSSDPNGKYYLNDFAVVKKGRMTSAMANVAEYLKNKNAHIGGIGIQSHLKVLPMDEEVSERQMDNAQRIFNYRLSRTRRIVENAFGILVHRFRCLFTTMQQEPDTVPTIVLTYVCLHNLMRKRSPKQHCSDADEEDPNHNVTPGTWCNVTPLLDGQSDFTNNTITTATKKQREPPASGETAAICGVISSEQSERFGEEQPDMFGVLAGLGGCAICWPAVGAMVSHVPDGAVIGNHCCWVCGLRGEGNILVKFVPVVVADVVAAEAAAPDDVAVEEVD
ncbi:hypothetical protein LSH36_38g06048 [Paralvinella palmiformis]|uniref:GH10 domain-containing protein n=1 Tax=Paralvinella palmiformis TaxID=53620 RepID=A0AAD9K8N9_9ANNE|nr:hypothetical protein LSH36_38g06048 [Paralvinella palmiformis]